MPALPAPAGGAGHPHLRPRDGRGGEAHRLCQRGADAPGFHLGDGTGRRRQGTVQPERGAGGRLPVAGVVRGLCDADPAPDGHRPRHGDGGHRPAGRRRAIGGGDRDGLEHRPADRPANRLAQPARGSCLDIGLRPAGAHAAERAEGGPRAAGGEHGERGQRAAAHQRREGVVQPGAGPEARRRAARGVHRPPGHALCGQRGGGGDQLHREAAHGGRQRRAELGQRRQHGIRQQQLLRAGQPQAVHLRAAILRDLPQL